MERNEFGVAARKQFEMSQEDLDALVLACKPVPYIVAGGEEPLSPQAKANTVWERLGNKMGFKWKTAKPVPGKGQRFFTAEPLERQDGDPAQG